MGKTSNLLKNTAIIGLGTFSTKALTFLLLPLYTNALNPDDFGLVDVLMTMSSLIIPFVALEMNSGVFRFLIGSEDGRKYSNDEVISTGIAIEFIGLIVAVILAYIANHIYSIPHFNAVVVYIFSLAISKLTLDTTRGFGDNVGYSISNIIITLISLVLNVVLILSFRCGAVAILVASSIGNFSGALFLFFKERMYQYINRDKISITAGREMLRYTLPLIPNTVSWWVASASDRLIILGFLGATANGVYAAAHKIPGVYTTLFTVFSLAWTEAVARNSSDNQFVESTVKTSINVMIYMLLGIISCSSLFFNVLIGKEYAESYWHILILLIAIFFSSISSLYGGIFSGKMDSKTVAYTTIVGAAVNIIFHIGMVRIIGLYAASISTTVSYVVIALIRGRQVRKWYSIKLFSKSDCILIPISCVAVLGFCLRNLMINIASIALICTGFIFNNKSIVKSAFIRIRETFTRAR